MARETDPGRTKRAEAFALWTKAPMPMLTIFKTMDVTRLVRLHKKTGYKFNALMCWCVGKAAAETEDFYLLPVGEKLMRYDHIAVNTVVTTRDGDINTCDVPASEDFGQFYQDYLRLTERVRDSGKPYDLGEDYMVVGTSSLAGHEIDGAVNIYAGFYNNPFLIWGKYRRHMLRATLPVSFQFHHAQMDGVPAAEFLERVQDTMDHLRL